MDNTFKCLLEVEAQAQATVDAAMKQREQIIAQARKEAHQASSGTATFRQSHPRDTGCFYP